MSSVNAVTQDLIFKARIASFRPMSSEDTAQMLKEFGIFLKQKGVMHEFIVWRVDLEGQVQDYA
jgi:hypothetical protein